VVVSVTPGWKGVVGEELEQLVETASAPVEIREVEHSFAELMAPVLDSSHAEVDFAGASMVGATVDAERNALVVELTEIDEDSVIAAAEVFGSDTLFTKGEQGSLTN
jgi:hypothetical protein